MIRLLGILVGSAIAVGVLIVVVGVPEFPDVRRPQSAAQRAGPAAAPEMPDEVVVEIATATVADSQTPSPAETTHEVASEPVQAPESPVVEHAIEHTIDPAGEATRWHAFWSPFRSEFAANGFVTQLQRSTGLDYRVVKQNPGVYEVAFAYTDDADARQKLAQISAATGLDLPEN